MNTTLSSMMSEDLHGGTLNPVTVRIEVDGRCGERKGGRAVGQGVTCLLGGSH